MTPEQERLAAIRERATEFYVYGDDWPNLKKKQVVGDDIPWLLDQLEQAEQRENVDKTALREMLGSYEALARMQAAGDTRPFEQAMKWDGPICARRALGIPEADA